VKFARFAPLALLVVLGCGGPSPVGKYSVDIKDPKARALLPGADQVVLELKEDGKVSLDAGPMNLLSTDWKMEGSKVTFGKSQGLVGANYELFEGNLVPLENGSRSDKWQFKKK